MAKNDNLGDFLTDIANSIRTKTQTSELINAQYFSDKILSIQTGGGNTLKKLLDATKTTQYLFSYYEGNDISNLIQHNDTSEVTNMSYMYSSCKASTFPILNMSKVTNASYMFYKCKNIVTAPILNLSNVQNCESIFRDCENLTTCEISDFSNANNTNGLFATCRKLKNTASNLTTPKVTDTGFMFYECNALETAPDFFNQEEEQESVLYTYKEKEKPFTIHNKGNGVWEVTGKKVERLVQMASFTTDDGFQRFALQIRNMGIDDALREAGCEDGDTVRLYDFEFEFYN